jgi:hypothetical protein
MIPPRFVPPGVLQLYEVIGEEKTLIIELPTSSKNRDRINKMRLDMLMVSPTKNLVLSENNSFNPPKRNNNGYR